MYFDDACHGPPLMISGLGHVPQQGMHNSLLQMTVSPADLFLTQPSHVPTQPYASPRNVASAGYGIMRCPVVHNTPHGAPDCHALTRVVQFMGHASGQFTALNVNDVPARCFTEPPRPVRRMSQESSMRCEWILEDLSRCGQTITERTVPKHLAEHGIRSIHKDRIVQCRWQGCGASITRQSITRHTREVHLGSKRKSTNTRLHGTTFVTDVV